MSSASRNGRARRKRISFRPLPVTKIPKVIPPRSVVILSSADPKRTPGWLQDRGRVFRIGYYSRRDGLNCICLVNDGGEYEQTTDRDALLRHFIILKLSNEKDFFGDSRPPLRALKTRRAPAFTVPELLAK